jgi:tetratricopeptide (TPR) repeat protein
VFRAAVAAAPQSSALWNDLGTTYLDIGDYVHAREAFERSVQSDHRNAEAWNNLGITLHNLGLLRPSLVAYERAVTVKPNFAAAWFNYANILAFTGVLCSLLHRCCDWLLLMRDGGAKGMLRLGLRRTAERWRKIPLCSAPCPTAPSTAR